MNNTNKRPYYFSVIRREKINDNRAIYTRHKGIINEQSSYDVEHVLKERFEAEARFSLDQITIRIGDEDGVVAVTWSHDDKPGHYPIVPFTNPQGKLPLNKDEYISFADFLSLRSCHYMNQWQSYFPVMRNIEEQLS